MHVIGLEDALKATEGSVGTLAAGLEATLEAIEAWLGLVGALSLTPNTASPSSATCSR